MGPRLLALLPALVAAGDPAPSGWTRFRGPNGTGVAEVGGLPAELDRERHVLWRRALPPGRSSPVLSAAHVVLSAEDGDELVTLALERATGEPAWRAVAPRPRRTAVDARNGPASPSPAVDDAGVVVFFPDFGLLAYDHAGRERWRVPLGPFENLYGMGASPVIVGDAVLLACDQNRGSYLACFERSTGALRWRAERPWARSGHCTPVVFEPSAPGAGGEAGSAGGGAQVLLPGSFYLDAYGLADGERLWWVSGMSFEMKSVPVLADGVVYLNGFGSPLNQPGNQVELPPFAAVLAEQDGDGDGRIGALEMPAGRAQGFFEAVDLDGGGDLDAEEWQYLRDALASQNGFLAVRAGGRGDVTAGALRWAWRRAVPQLPSPLLYRGVLYLLADSGGIVTTFDPATGEVLGRARLEQAVTEFYASPVAGDGKVFLVGLEGQLVTLPAGGGLEPLWVGSLDETCHATPAQAEGRVWVRSSAALYCFGADGE